MLRKKSALVVRVGGIGDNLIASSVLHLLKREEYHITFMAREPCHVVLENNPYIDLMIVKREKDDLPIPADQFNKFFWDRRFEYDRIINLSYSVEGTLALFMHSTPFYWPAAVRRKLCDVNYLERTHDIACVPHEFRVKFYPTDEEVADALRTREKIGPFIGWCLSGSRVDKTYPYSTHAITRLIELTNTPVVLFGSPSDKDHKYAKSVRDEVEKSFGNVKMIHAAIKKDVDGKNLWPIRRSLAMAQQADLMIGPDTGVMWSVCMEDMSKLVLLSHASPENITKHWANTTSLHATADVDCWPCHQLHDSRDTCRPNKENTGAACISSITVDGVITSALKLWRDRHG